MTEPSTLVESGGAKGWETNRLMNEIEDNQKILRGEPVLRSQTFVKETL